VGADELAQQDAVALYEGFHECLVRKMVQQRQISEEANQQHRFRRRGGNDGATDSYEGSSDGSPPKCHKRAKYVSKAWYVSGTNNLTGNLYLSDATYQWPMQGEEDQGVKPRCTASDGSMSNAM
jgi:hypothetical protein